jgi:hypothetical protein
LRVVARAAATELAEVAAHIGSEYLHALTAQAEGSTSERRRRRSALSRLRAAARSLAKARRRVQLRPRPGCYSEKPAARWAITTPSGCGCRLSSSPRESGFVMPRSSVGSNDSAGRRATSFESASSCRSRSAGEASASSVVNVGCQCSRVSPQGLRLRFPVRLRRRSAPRPAASARGRRGGSRSRRPCHHGYGRS